MADRMSGPMEMNSSVDSMEMFDTGVMPLGQEQTALKSRSHYGSFLSTYSKIQHPASLPGASQIDIIDSEGSDTDTDSSHCIIRTQAATRTCCRKNSKIIKYITLSILFVAYCVYLAFAVRYSLEHSKALLVITGLVCLVISYVFIRNRFGNIIFKAVCAPAKEWLEMKWSIIRWFLYPALVLAVVLYLTIDVICSARQLQPLLGMAIFIFVPIISSKYPGQIKWRPVLWGFTLQFVLGILVMRWRDGYNAVQWLSQQINTFLFYSLDGAAAVFGDPFFVLHPFITIVVSLIIWIGAVVGVMYHVGLIQLVAQKVGWFMQLTLQTTAIESISLAVNIFLSVLETVLMMKPYFSLLTESEFHCFLVGCHSTIAGFAFGLFVLFGVSPQHLLTGAVMSAPAAVAVSKINWPETQESLLRKMENFKLAKGTEKNWVEAAVNGAWTAGKSVMSITLQVIAFMSMYFFADSVVIWLGQRVGIEITIARILGWIFTPVAFVMGVDWVDLHAVGRLLGLKRRSAAIATYAMCGFSSFGTLAMLTGVWLTVDKSRTTAVVKQVPRLMLNTNLACFMTACIAGVFYTEDVEMHQDSPNPALDFALWILSSLPSVRDLLEPIGLVP